MCDTQIAVQDMIVSKHLSQLKAESKGTMDPAPPFVGSLNPASITGDILDLASEASSSYVRKPHFVCLGELHLDFVMIGFQEGLKLTSALAADHTPPCDVHFSYAITSLLSCSSWDQYVEGRP